jgi:hypothetical protein
MFLDRFPVDDTEYTFRRLIISKTMENENERVGRDNGENEREIHIISMSPVRTHTQQVL